MEKPPKLEANMGKAINTTASWIGKAAYELTQSKGMSGRTANARARSLAEGLLDYGVDLSTIDPRGYARDGSARQVLPVPPAYMSSSSVSARQNRQSAFLNQF